MVFIFVLAELTILALMTLAMADNSSPLNANGVRLQAQDTEKILVTTRAFKKNDILLIVPSVICLLAHRGGVVRGLQGQTDQLWDEVGDLREPLTDEQIVKGRTWDVQLALALLDATVGTGLAGDLWDQYAIELPKPETVTLPFCFNSIELLNQLQCNSMKRNALRQQQRLREISKEVFTDHLQHRVTAASVQRTCNTKAVPTPLQWAFAMVRSRCFKVAQDWFAIVPMIDMANHNLIPSARFEVFNGVPTEGLPSNADSNKDSLVSIDRDIDITEDTVFLLRATRDLQEGEEVTICYDQTYTNERLFVQYGFSLKGNPSDEVFLTEDGITNSALFPSADSNNIVIEEKEVVCGGVQRAIELILLSSNNIVRNGELSPTDLRNSFNDDSVLRTHAASRSLLNHLSSVPSVQSSVVESEVTVLNRMLDEVNALAVSYPTTLSEDKATYLSLCSSTDILVVINGSTVSQYSSSSSDKNHGFVNHGIDGTVNNANEINTEGAVLNRCQLMACVRRRIERKELLLCAQSLLKGALSQANAAD